MGAETEARETASWLIEQINETTYLDRLEFIAETIREDTKLGAEYAIDETLKSAIREAWMRRQREIQNDVGQAGERR